MKQTDKCVMNLQANEKVETKFSTNYYNKVSMIIYLLIFFFLSSSLSCETKNPAIEVENPPIETQEPPIESEEPPVETEEPPKENDDTSDPDIPIAQRNLIIGYLAVVPTDDVTFDRLSKAGVNYLHSYRHNTPKENNDFFDLAHKYNMKVMFNLRAKNNIRNGDENWLSTTMKDVESFKDHAALGMWYMWDEPEDKMLPNVTKLRQEIEKISNTPTALAIHWRTGWTNTRGHSDIWMVDYYPVRGQDFPLAPLQSYTAFVGSAAQRKLPGTPFIPILQACDFTRFPEQASIEDKSKLRFPNLTEMRFMAFSSLTYGIHGMFFYSYYHSRLSATVGQVFFYEALVPVLNEVNAFDKIVNEPWDVVQNFKLNKDENINLGYWARTNGKFMVLTNNSPEVRNLKIDLTKEVIPLNSKLTPWGQTSETIATLNKGILTINNVQPWEVFIWQLIDK